MIKTITKTDGTPYSVRQDKSRYFYPEEWDKFYNALKESRRPLFDFLMNTGCRIDEALHIRPMDFDFDRGNVRLWKTKTKARKGEKIGKPRTIPLGQIYLKRAKRASKEYANEE